MSLKQDNLLPAANILSEDLTSLGKEEHNKKE